MIKQLIKHLCNENESSSKTSDTSSILLSFSHIDLNSFHAYFLDWKHTHAYKLHTNMHTHIQVHNVFDYFLFSRLLFCNAIASITVLHQQILLFCVLRFCVFKNIIPMYGTYIYTTRVEENLDIVYCALFVKMHVLSSLFFEKQCVLPELLTQMVGYNGRWEEHKRRFFTSRS